MKYSLFQKKKIQQKLINRRAVSYQLKGKKLFLSQLNSGVFARREQNNASGRLKQEETEAEK